MKKNKISTIEDLATLIQGEFISIKNEMNEGFKGVNKRFDKIEKELLQIKLDLDNLKLRQDQCAYRFEVKDLDRRIKKLEAKLGLC